MLISVDPVLPIYGMPAPVGKPHPAAHPVVPSEVVPGVDVETDKPKTKSVDMHNTYLINYRAFCQGFYRQRAPFFLYLLS